MRRRHRHLLLSITRTLLLYLILPIALLLALRLIWGWEAAYRLAKVQADLRTQGVHFEHTPVNTPEDQNPAAALTKAVQALSLSGLDSTYIESDYIEYDALDYATPSSWTDDKKTYVIDLLKRNQEAFRWIDDAASRTGAVPVPRSDDDSNLAPSRSLSQLLAISAHYQHHQHNDLQALRDLQRIYHLADVIDRGGTLLHSLVALANRSRLAMTVEQLSPSLQLDPADGTRDAALALLRLLQDPAPLNSIARNAESEIGLVPAFAAQRQNLNNWWIRPLRDDEIARTMQVEASYLPGLRAHDWPTAKKFLRPIVSLHPDDNNLNAVTFPNSTSPFAPYNVMQLHFRGISDTRAAAILLAARLFETQHHKLPSQLPDLIPQFLSAAPLDPFSPADATMHFRSDPQGPTVWSVGENLTDQGGIVKVDARGTRLRRYDNNSPYSQSDIIYGSAWLNAKPPPPLSSFFPPVPPTMPATTSTPSP